MSSIPAQPLRVPFARTMNILFVCFGDNESRGESETILTLFFSSESSSSMAVGFLTFGGGGGCSFFCENENIHGFSIVNICISCPFMDVFKGNLNFH